jgi:hypothetical protein
MAMNAGVWSEVCLVSIQPKGGTEVQLAAMTETVDIDPGSKDIEQIATLIGGRVVKKVPQDITTITFEGYPIGIATANNKGLAQFFHITNAATYDTTEPLAVTSSLGRDLFRVVILWSEVAPATASAITSALSAAYRFTAANAYMTSYKESFTDGILKATFEFKVPPFNKQGTAQTREESTETATNTTSALQTLSAYTTGNFPEDGTTFTW